MTGVQATIIYLLVLLSGTPNTGYEVRSLFKYETLKDCDAAKKEWLAAFPDVGNLDKRLACVKHNDKLAFKDDYR